jgi:hypothetical protein
VRHRARHRRRAIDRDAERIASPKIHVTNAIYACAHRARLAWRVDCFT